jgi:Cu(I)/Ag(I) efflux system membrane fusion protein
MTPHRRRILVSLLLAAGLGLLLVLFWKPIASWFTGPEAAAPPVANAADTGVYWTCPMHPSVKQSGPGKCPLCGMDLTRVGGPETPETRPGETVLDPERRQLIGVRTGTVVTRPVEAEVRAVGRVAFDETRFEDVTTRYGGFIGRLHVEQTGQAVRRGQTLFTLYSPELYAAQREYLVALASQRAARETGAPDRADYLVEAARRKLRLWELSDAQIRGIAERGEPIEQIAVPSPASGYIVEKDVVQGAAVQPGMRLFRIAGLDRVWVEAQVYESELPRVRPGQTAAVTLPYLPGQSFQGRVSLILPGLDPESRTGQVRIEVANRATAGGPMLKPDMYADVRLAGQAREALMVPASAVLYTGPRNLVFLDLGEGRFQQREVQLGPKAGEYFEVLSGLQEGDRVVTSGNFLLDAETRLKSGGEHDHG